MATGAHAAAGEAAVARFFAAHKAKRRDRAGIEAMAALEAYFAIEDPASQRKELVPLLELFERGGLQDLLLVVLVRLAELERKLDNAAALGEVLIRIGNVYTELQNFPEARRYNERALATALARNASIDAASASTNLASLLARQGELAAALPVLRRSMELIAKDEPGANDHTDFVTRMMLIQVLDALESDTDEAIAVARPLFGRLSQFAAQVRQPLEQILERIAGRYHAAHRTGDEAEWKAQALPELWGSR